MWWMLCMWYLRSLLQLSSHTLHAQVIIFWHLEMDAAQDRRGEEDEGGENFSHSNISLLSDVLMIKMTYTREHTEIWSLKISKMQYFILICLIQWKIFSSNWYILLTMFGVITSIHASMRTCSFVFCNNTHILLPPLFLSSTVDSGEGATGLK